MTKFRTVTAAMMVMILSLAVEARKPAVEDFVGIDMEHPEATPQGTETLFNFEKDIKDYKSEPNAPAKLGSPQTGAANSPFSLKNILTVTFIFGLPALIWFLIMQNLRQKAKVESASNIEVLEKYRREKELARKAQDEEELKKVS